jgi:hypothetical protein
MNISELKKKLGVETLDFSYLKDDQGNRAVDPKTAKPTLWGKHWDNDNRASILMHEDTLKAIKADPTGVTNLGVKTNTITPDGKDAYTQHIVVTYTAPDMGSV